MTLFAINVGILIEYAVAATQEHARDIAKQRGYVDESIIDITPVPDVTGIPYNDYCTFHNEFMEGKYQGQRYGQAFLNVFDHNLLVKAFRYGGYIWQDNNPASVIDKLFSNELIVL